ncbi:MULTISPECIES: glycoside hydrolase family 26 protein [unclassified Streptomyces]|uniref:glycoside hydrolase family 26 protein n=1 Tax=unclassified Streptomyces TaxID=2593676 RepID=UPI002E29F188|nr:glycosyl hydrolase [Streptomyces sp. NBC_00223]
MADRRQWWTRTGLGAVAAALLLSGPATSALGDEATPGSGAVADSASEETTAASSGSADPAASAPFFAVPLAGELSPLGAFTDSGADGVASLAELQTWLGGTEVRVGHTYLPGDNWESIEGDDELLQPWAQWTRAASGRMFVLNVPMQQNNEDHLSDQEVRDRIRSGARGANDAHFTALARRLVKLGVPDTVIVLGWEMNGTTYTHRCGPDPADWKTYWKRIVTAMRAVPGQHFRFDFAPNRGQDAIAWTECYPGDASVDVIGMDSYDQPRGETFFDEVTEPYGLQAQVDFAAAHKKPISYPEWGLFRNGDDPDYMSLMLEWIFAHRPLYQTLTDYCPHGVLQCTENPKASQVYRALLYARKTAPAGGTAAAASPGGTPTPTPTPTPTSAPAVTGAGSAAPAGASAASCVPMELTDTLKVTYDSGQVCVELRPRESAAPVATP